MGIISEYLHAEQANIYYQILLELLEEPESELRNKMIKRLLPLYKCEADDSYGIIDSNDYTTLIEKLSNKKIIV